MEQIIGKNSKNYQAGDEGQWISVSDLMAGLMMVFLFASVALMRDALAERDKIKEVAITYQKNQVAIYESLLEEFKDDLDDWDAEINSSTLSFQFKSPDVLFGTGQIKITSKFQKILKNFFPRYLDVLLNFKESISEIRIEGHTSSIWNSKSTKDEAYFKNMELSQGRTRSALSYVHNLPQVYKQKKWIEKHIAAVGFSSAKLIYNTDGTENQAKSRRVSFRVITNAETHIRKILEQ